VRALVEPLHDPRRPADLVHADGVAPGRTRPTSVGGPQNGDEVTILSVVVVAGMVLAVVGPAPGAGAESITSATT